MSRIKRGWELTKKSWGLLSEHRELMRFPLYGAVATIPLRVHRPRPRPLPDRRRRRSLGASRWLVIGFYLLSVVGIYFSVGLAAAADMIFHGQEATVGDGLAVARSRFSQIGGWAAVSTAIGLVQRAREPGRHRRPDRRAACVGIGWSLVTFLAVPVIALEGTGAVRDAEALGRALQDALGPADHRQHRDRRRRLPARHAAERAPDRRRRPVWASAGFVGALLRRARRDRLRDLAADLAARSAASSASPSTATRSTARRSAASPPRSWSRR